jgi:hypothetical protein
MIVIVVRREMMAATYVFGTDLYIGADTLDEARDGLLELLAMMVRGEDSGAFDVKEVIYEEKA